MVTFVQFFFLQKQFTKMANTKLEKKKKGVITANGLNNDAGNASFRPHILDVVDLSSEKYKYQDWFPYDSCRSQQAGH